MKKYILFILMFSTLVSADLPKGFMYVQEKIPSIDLDMRYYSENNFVGRTIDGYLAPKAILTTEATLALLVVQNELKKFGIGLKVYDAYRPQKAVNHFVRWSKDLKDMKRKELYYPTVEKKNLFDEGYIAKKSGHSRGSTVDLTLIDLESKKVLDMGSTFDFFGKPSWLNYHNITIEQKTNRMLLNFVMLKYGFKSYAQEWWHFTLKNEPFKKSYFNFNVQ